MGNNWLIQAKKSQNQDVKALLSKYLDKNTPDEDKNDIKLSIMGLLDIDAVEESQESDTEETPVKDETPKEPELQPAEESTVVASPAPDMNEPALNPRLAKIGITREEELFIQGVVIRPMSRQDRILVRRSIANKKDKYQKELMAAYKQQQAETKRRNLTDPKVIAFNRKQKFVMQIRDALQQNWNFDAMFAKIDGFTIQDMDELIKDSDVLKLFEQYYQGFEKNYLKWKKIFGKM